MRHAVLVAWLLMLSTLGGCASNAGKEKVSGTIHYGWSATNLLDTKIKLVLAELDEASGKSKNLEYRTLMSPGKPPIAYEIHYDPSDIDPAKTYALGVRVIQEGRLRLLNKEPVYVITHGNPTSGVDVTVDLVGAN